MRTLMKPFIERDSEMRAKEQEYAALKRRQGKKDEVVYAVVAVVKRRDIHSLFARRHLHRVALLPLVISF